MFDVSIPIDGTGCAICGELLFAERYVRVRGALVRVFCSPECQDAAARADWLEAKAFLSRAAKRLLLGGVLLGAWLLPHGALWPWRSAPAAPNVPLADDAPPPAASGLPVGWFGPEWPPTETSVLAALGRDAWVHPLAGPVRRMPRSDSRVFGADRPGNRAIECRNGHCGVDLGGEIWGEHVRAAHDGVVDYVQRGPNPDHGGRFVRIAHHDGTVFTQYFHLAAIARGLERGVAVKGGQVIGLLGDSGVKESAPHLHFAVSVRATPGGHEKYIDPEPLIALWPLRVPVEGSEVGLVTITAPPGVPLGSALRRSRARGRAGQGAAAAAASPETASPAEDAPAPAEEGTEPASPAESSVGED
ncbi:MAG TPA: M23 family metallopeptidase [Polyangia bacterium]|nr:M23 family metallopeptidase [Polyangia bacterium]